MTKTLLGKQVIYKRHYCSSIIKKELRRNVIPSCKILGKDVWHAYEFCYLNQFYVPEVRILQFIIDANSKYIFESKSVKLYLFSYSNLQFVNEEAVITQLKKDFSSKLETNVLEIKLLDLIQDFEQITTKMITSDFICLEKKIDFSKNKLDFKNLILLKTKITPFNEPSFLQPLKNNEATKMQQQKMYTNLLKSNCKITKQPDWGSLFIKYYGVPLNEQDYQKILYLILSFRNQNKFHETCADEIFQYLYNFLVSEVKGAQLQIWTRYTRRGGIDINPVRTDKKNYNLQEVLQRQIRQ